MNKPERASYTALDFVGWSDADVLILTPKFQRRGVWTDGARSFLIDTLLAGMPVPPIYLRIRQSDDKKKVIREVVDGQQRIASILKFIRGEFPLAKSVSTRRLRGKRFANLTPSQRDAITQFSFNCEVFQGVSDQDILEVFRRLNTYSIPLNGQELRNGRFFGFFKQTAYELAFQHVEFWRKHRILSERSIARMLEVELTSELLIAQLAGLQDKKKTIDDFYERFDDRFPQQRKMEVRFNAIVSSMEDALGDALRESEFRRPPLFYTLWCAIYHRLYKMPGVRLRTPRRALNASEASSLRAAVAKLSLIIERAKADDVVPSAYGRFVSACLRQTDNIIPRRTRLEVLYREAF